MKSTLLIHPSDNVLVALKDLKAGEEAEARGETIKLIQDIPAKHKIAIRALQAGDSILMYGTLVGTAQTAIPAGGAITTSNVKHAATPYGKKQKEYHWAAPDVAAWKQRTFMGYHRADGQVGIRNYWLVIPLVFCENRNILTLKEAFLNELGYGQPDLFREQVRLLRDAYLKDAQIAPSRITLPTQKSALQTSRTFEHVDGIKFLTHESGCGESDDDSANLCALLAGYCVNPNVGGVTVLSLGCQKAQIEKFKEALFQKDPRFSKPLFIFEQQKMKTEVELLSAAVKSTFEGLIQINQLRRSPAPLSALSVGVKCGGSDGFSGISANPAIGHTADLVAALGGRVLIAEFPELCGMEQELIDRAVDEATGERFAMLMTEYAERARAIGANFDMNPSPGNIKDGLITDAMKSAGAAKKAGTSPVTAAVGYGQYATKSGLNLVCTPGNDVLATTGMGGAGATVQLFTTGLGTPTGNPISPMVKISTNTTLATKMPDIIDIDAGPIIAGEKSVEEVGEQVLEYIIGLANGEYDTKAMQLGQDDFMFWKRGVSL